MINLYMCVCLCVCVCVCERERERERERESIHCIRQCIGAHIICHDECLEHIVGLPLDWRWLKKRVTK
jgi:hypothetical protein